MRKQRFSILKQPIVSTLNQQQFLAPHIPFLKKTLLFLFFYLTFYLTYLLYTYDRSFRVHQATLSRVLLWNNRNGIFCSQIHIGHDGTTLEFGTIPKEVGTAGPIDPSTSSAIPVDQFYLHGLAPSSLFLLIIPLFVVLLLILYLFFKIKMENKKKSRDRSREETGSEGQTGTEQ